MKFSYNLMTPDKKLPKTLDTPPYHAYLIRCWLEGNSWRFSLETIGQDHPRRGFTTLQELTIYLSAQLTPDDNHLPPFH